MRRFQFTIRELLLIIVIAALAAGWWTDHQRINRLAVQQWEYRWSGNGVNIADQLGDQGWEGFAMSPQTGDILFKRPKR